MEIIRLSFSCIALTCFFCGCRDRNLAQREMLPSVRHVVLQFLEDGGRNLNTVHICDEITREIDGVTNMEMRVQHICMASEAVTSMDFSHLSCSDKVEAAYKYWHLFSQFYNLLLVPGISDEQRMSFLVRCMKRYKAISFSVPMTARMQGESERDFAIRKTAILQLYSEYVNNVRLWERVFRSGALRTMKSVDGERLDRATTFLAEYPSKSDLLQSPVFAETTRTSGKDVVQSPVVLECHSSEYSEDGNGSKCQRRGE